jgi:hypothetical protein
MSLWQRRVTAGRRDLVESLLRLEAVKERKYSDADEKLARAYEIAANVLYKLGERHD